MGLFSSDKEYDLEPVDVTGEPLCVFGPEYVTPKPVMLKMANKWSWSGDDFTVPLMHSCSRAHIFREAQTK